MKTSYVKSILLLLGLILLLSLFSIVKTNIFTPKESTGIDNTPKDLIEDINKEAEIISNREIFLVKEYPPQIVWKKYVNTEQGFEFEYPETWGDVVIEKRDRKMCPEMKTYRLVGQFESDDMVVRFTSPIKVDGQGSDASYMFRIVDTENSTNVCGLDLLSLADTLRTSEYAAFSQVPHPAASEMIVSDIFTPLGTSAGQFYTLLFRGRNRLRVVQAEMDFAQYYNSDSYKEIQEIIEETNKSRAVIDFVKSGKVSSNLRASMGAFNRVVMSFKYTK